MSTTTNRFAIRAVATASFFDLVSGSLKARLDGLKTSGLENSASVVYSMGGAGNPKRVGFSSDKAVKFSLQDCGYEPTVIGMLMGNPMVVGATPVIHSEELIVASDSVSLTYTPNASGAIVSVNAVNTDGTIGDSLSYVASTPTATQYSITGKVITFEAATFADGKKIRVYYNTLSGTGTKQLVNKTDKFAGSYKLVLDVLVRDEYSATDYAAQIVVPKAKIEDNWKLDMAATGDPSTFDIPLEALAASGSTDLYTMNIYDEDDLS